MINRQLVPVLERELARLLSEKRIPLDLLDDLFEQCGFDVIDDEFIRDLVKSARYQLLGLAIIELTDPCIEFRFFLATAYGIRSYEDDGMPEARRVFWAKHGVEWVNESNVFLSHRMKNAG